MTVDIRLAVVGSTKFSGDIGATDKAREIIVAALEYLNPDAVISGGAVGIDTLAANVARSRGIELVVHTPTFPRWQPEGYKERNIRIAEYCTHLLAIRHSDSRTYGSGWTADYAEKIGRTVYRRAI